MDLDTLKESIRLQIRKEFKIKEGAENLLKVSRDKKAKAHVGSILKTCNERIDQLRSDLTALLAQVPDEEGEWVWCIVGVAKISCIV